MHMFDFYDPENPAPGLVRIVAAGVALYGGLTDNRPLFYSAMFVVFIVALLPRPSKPIDVEAMEALSDEEFERQRADYQAGRRKTLPGQ